MSAPTGPALAVDGASGRPGGRIAPHLGRIRRPALAVLLVLAVVLTMLWALQRRLIYFPDQAVPPPPAGTRELSLDTADGLRLRAWLVTPAGSDRGAAVLVAPGNGGNRWYRMSLAAALSAEGLTVLLLDYRGYGGNPGSPSETGLAADARAAWSWLTGAGGFRPARVILFGESLGAAVATGLAAGLSQDGSPPGGLVLRSPFDSLAAVGRTHYPLLPVGLLLRDRFEVGARIGRVSAPTAVVYGTADSIVPPDQSRAVARRVTDPVAVTAVDRADHNDPVLAEGPAVLAAVVAVADRLAT